MRREAGRKFFISGILLSSSRVMDRIVYSSPPCPPPSLSPQFYQQQRPKVTALPGEEGPFSSFAFLFHFSKKKKKNSFVTAARQSTYGNTNTKGALSEITGKPLLFLLFAHDFIWYGKITLRVGKGKERGQEQRATFFGTFPFYFLMNGRNRREILPCSVFSLVIYCSFEEYEKKNYVIPSTQAIFCCRKDIS